VKKGCRAFAAAVVILGLMSLSSCTTTDQEHVADPANPSAAAVPGEVNPNAPGASQQVRTTPGFNF
jgi:hypothetical protein